MKILDIKLTYNCNNKCQLCCQEDNIKNSSSKIEYFQIEDYISKMGKESILDTKVVLTGGEPTLHEDIIDIVKLFKDRGFKYIQLQSNATMSNISVSIEELIDAGVNSFGVSLHGCTEPMHERFTCTKGSFFETVKSLRTISKNKIPVALNCVISKYNVDYLEEIVSFVGDEKLAAMIQFAFIHIMGRANEHIDLVPSITIASNAIKKAIDKGKEIGIKVKSEAVPFCLMRGYEKNVSEIEKMQDITILDKNGCMSFSDQRGDVLKGKTLSCKQCLFFSMCEGPWIEYPTFFGWDEFLPVRTIKDGRNRN